MYADPQRIVCGNCSSIASYRVADLLSLSAMCSSCESLLIDAGLDMRKQLDESARFIVVVELAMALERKLGVSFADSELESVHTLSDFINPIERHTQSAGTIDHLPRTFLISALSQSMEESDMKNSITALTLEDLDKPIMDALDPDRWRNWA